MKRIAVAAFLGLAACAHPAAQDDPPARPLVLWKGYSDHPPGYLGEHPDPAIVAFLPPPPAEGSLRARDDAAIYRATRKLEGTPRWKQAADDSEIFAPDFAFKAFACALGAKIAPEQAPRLTLMLGRVPADIDGVTERVKKTTMRKRPVVVDPRPICLPAADWLLSSTSYPSGHAATGWALGLILSELAPDRAGPILTRAAGIGDSRVICGVHYQSDVEIGRQVGAAVVAVLRARPDFEADLDAARAELAAARRTAPKPTCPTE